MGGEILELLLAHPEFDPVVVTSRSQAGKPVHSAHPRLRGRTELTFSGDEDSALFDTAAVFVAAGHGESVETISRLVEGGYQGVIVDMSADFRIRDAAYYPHHFGYDHPRPDLLEAAWYGLPEITGPPPVGTKLIANPGCFATSIALALWPLSQAGVRQQVAVTALTGASGSGTAPSPGTHYPTRDGNVRAYKVMTHQHQPEIEQTLRGRPPFSFVPVSGPWTRGIWGTAQLQLPATVDVATLYQDAYGRHPLMRLWPGELPQLKPVVGTPFCDIGWMRNGEAVVIGFATDNLLKGAASQAVQNLNLVLGLDETTGLV